MKIRVATEEIRDRIMQNIYEAGSHLQEHELADELGVSRTPIRSALNTLHKEGLLNYFPKRGYFVREESPDEVLQAWTFRGGMEGLACKIIAGVEAEPSLEARLNECLAFGDHSLEPDDLTLENIVNYRKMNNDFHGTIVDASGNIFLIETMNRFKNIPVYVQLLEKYYSVEGASPNRLLPWLRRMHDDHHRIADAIICRQAQRAEALMIEHHYFASQYITQRMTRSESE
ncbi:MAG: GntR family transcriptional regulator [Rhodobiaceae bacterium]|nr:GntR family transcriptional regulator [Rhodobiaceae bacterium]